jgi:hypothetical protein
LGRISRFHLQKLLDEIQSGDLKLGEKQIQCEETATCNPKVSKMLIFALDHEDFMISLAREINLELQKYKT